MKTVLALTTALALIAAPALAASTGGVGVNGGTGSGSINTGSNVGNTHSSVSGSHSANTTDIEHTVTVTKSLSVSGTNVITSGGASDFDLNQ